MLSDGGTPMKYFVHGLLICSAAALIAVAATPDGWLLAGNKPANYDTGIDRSAVFGGRASAFLKAKADQDGFGTLMQSIAAANYLGKRVRLSGYVKSDNVVRWAGLWMRVDGQASEGTPKPLAFDN